MEVTEVRVNLMPPQAGKYAQLRAYCSVTFDEVFVVRDLKVIEADGRLFVAMPSRRLTDRCARCSAKNAVTSRFCGWCGERLASRRAVIGRDGRARTHEDVAHPIDHDCRTRVQDAVLEAYNAEVDRSLLPGYAGRWWDGGEDAGPAAGADPAPDRYEETMELLVHQLEG